MSSWSFPGPLSSASPAHLSFFSAWTLTALLAATLEETGVLLFVEEGGRRRTCCQREVGWRERGGREEDARRTRGEKDVEKDRLIFLEGRQQRGGFRDGAHATGAVDVPRLDGGVLHCDGFHLRCPVLRCLGLRALALGVAKKLSDLLGGSRSRQPTFFFLAFLRHSLRPADKRAANGMGVGNRTANLLSIHPGLARDEEDRAAEEKSDEGVARVARE